MTVTTASRRAWHAHRHEAASSLIRVRTPRWPTGLGNGPARMPLDLTITKTSILKGWPCTPTMCRPERSGASGDPKPLCHREQYQRLAAKTGFTVEIRFRTPSGRVKPSQWTDSRHQLRIDKCLLAVKPAFEHGRTGSLRFQEQRFRGGRDTGRRTLSVEHTVHVRTSAACMGQRLATVCLQLVCQTTSLVPTQV